MVALADDLTSALEVGARFAERGAAARVTVAMDGEQWPRTEVLVIDTETRHLAPQEAMRVMRAAARSVRGLAPALIYKKTDSTLRGNIAAEFRVLREVWPHLPLVYVPAYPAMGRTVRDGRLFVDGVPLELTAFAQDPLNPTWSGEIRTVLGDVEVEVIDGETDEDVRSAARAIAAKRPFPMAAGPAALAGSLAEALIPGNQPHPLWPGVVRALVVNGSLHPASAAQIESLRERHGQDWRIFEPAGIAGEGLERAFALAKAVKQELERKPTQAVVVCGGDTAFAIHQELSGDVFEPVGEIVPGVPVSRCGGLIWLTKAGGFGAREILCDIQRRLR